MRAGQCVRLVPLDPTEPHLSHADSWPAGVRVRARFDVLVREIWVGVLHLGAGNHWYLLTGTSSSRDRREELELAPGRVEFLGPRLGPDPLGDLAERRLLQMEAARLQTGRGASA